MGKLPTLPMALTPTRASVYCCRRSSTPSSLTQVRNATFIPRPRRPYTFTQLVQLSDGSTYTIRTTSPQPLYAPAKDTRNTLLWQPSEKSLHNVELDEAGKLAAFRERFGRAFDITSDEQGGGQSSAAAGGAAQDEGFADLITGYAGEANTSMRDSGPKKIPKKRK